MNNARNDCSKEDVFYVCKSTVDEIINEFEERINQLQREKNEAENQVTQLHEQMSELSLSQAQITQTIILKVIDIFENEYINMSPEEMEKEYLYRLKSNITYRQFREYARWNREIKNQRSFSGRFHFEVNGVEYSVPRKRIHTECDATTRINLMKAMYDLNFPEPEKIQGCPADGIVVDS